MELQTWLTALLASLWNPETEDAAKLYLESKAIPGNTITLQKKKKNPHINGNWMNCTQLLFSCSVLSDSVIPWTAAGQASLAFIISLSLLKLISIELMCIDILSLSCVWLFVTSWAIAHQAPLSIRFPRQEYRGGLPFTSINSWAPYLFGSWLLSSYLITSLKDAYTHAI